jgi:hypothetical protein
MRRQMKPFDGAIRFSAKLCRIATASFFPAEALLKSHSAESVFRKLITLVILSNPFFASQ